MPSPLAGRVDGFMVAVDDATRRPLCAVWQSQFGGDPLAVCAMVPGESWQVEPPERLDVRRFTHAQLRAYMAEPDAEEQGVPRC